MIKTMFEPRRWLVFYTDSMQINMLCYSFYWKMMHKWLLTMTLITYSVEQISATWGNTSATATPIIEISLYQDSTSPKYPQDTYLNVQMTINSIYTLGTKYIVQVYNKTNPSQQLQCLKDYSYGSQETYAFIYMSVDTQNTLVTLTSYNNLIVQHLQFNITPTGTLQYHTVFGYGQFTTSPVLVFTKAPLIYSYIRNTNTYDQVYVVNTTDNSSYTITLTLKNCSILVSPDRLTALLWDKNCKVYIHSTINNFTHTWTYLDSSTSGVSSSVASASFSPDSSLAVIENDNFQGIHVINLTSQSTLASFSSTGIIKSVSFIEGSNRYLLVQKSNEDIIYDLQNSQWGSLNGTFPSNVVPDTNTSQLFSLGSKTIKVYGLNMYDGTTAIAIYSLPTTSTTPAQTVDYSDAENATMTFLCDGVAVVDDIVDNVFSVVFSTPLAIYFLTTFNYFTLCSFYVLLNMAIPELLYYYLGALFQSSQSDVLTQLHLSLAMPKISIQRVIDSRPISLNVSSDLFSVNCNSCLILIINVILIESIIFLSSRKVLSFRKVNKVLIKERPNLYWGLVVSNIVPFLLPWKYSIMGSYNNFSSAFNLALQYLMLVLLGFWTALVTSRRVHGQLQTKKQQLRWWPSYENVIYPLLLLVDNPICFLTVIGCSNLYAFYLAFWSEEYRKSSIIKTIYPILFHAYFVVFLGSKNNRVLVISSTICLVVFMLGSIHFLFQTCVCISKTICQVIKTLCIQNKVNPQQSDVQIKEKNGLHRHYTRHKLRKVQFNQALGMATAQVKPNLVRFTRKAQSEQRSRQGIKSGSTLKIKKVKDQKDAKLVQFKNSKTFVNK